MVSKNNQWQHLQATAQRVPHYGLRKLSVGVASVLLSTTLYMGVSAQADTLNQSTNATTAVTQVPSGDSSTAVPGSAHADPNSNNQSNAVKQPAVAATMAGSTSSRVPASGNTPTISAAQLQFNVNKQVSTTGSAPSVSSNSLVRRPVLRLAAQSTTSDPFAGGGVIDNWGNMNDPNPHKASPINFAKWNKGLPSRKEVISHANINGVNVDISQIFNVAYANTLPYSTPGKIRTSGRVAWNSVINGKTYSDGNGSAYNSSTTTDISIFGYGVPQYYWRINGSGNSQVAIVYDLKTLYESSHPGEKFDDSILGRTLTEVYNVTSDGSIEHLFYITNKATRTDKAAAYDKFPNADKYNYYRDFLTLQLELFGDKNLPVFSDGNGGAITSKNGYTVFAQPMFGVQVASHQAIPNNPRNTPHYTLLNNVPAGTKTLNGDVPAAVDYIFKQRTINPGETYVYGFKETVMPSFDIQKQGIIKVSYTDKNGNELAKGKSETLNLRSKYQINALAIPGYYLTSMPANASGTVGFGITDIKFIYEKGYIATVKYVDDEKGSVQVGSLQTLKGAVGSKVATNIKAPTNYVLSGTYPAEYTFTAAANQQLVVHLRHARQNVTDQKRVMRTVNYTDPTTKRTKAVTTQTVTLQRSGTKDLVTNETKWNNWNTAQWAKVGAPNVTGYRVTNPDAAAVMTVTSGTSNTTVDFTYVAGHQDSSIVYVDDDKGGARVKTVPLGGNTGATVKTNIAAPSGYVLNGTYPSEYTFKPSGNTALTVHLKHGKQSVNDQKTVTRTVNYTDPKTSQTKLVERQTVTLHRSGTKDLVTNNTAWNAWSTGQFKAVSAPSVAGYHVANGNAAGALVVNDQSKDSTVTFTYAANAQTTHVKYVDKDNPSNVIHTTNVSGKTDQTVSVPSEVPAGWQLVSGQQVPTRVTFTNSGYSDTTVKIEHKHTTVTPDHPKTTNDKLPDNPTKSYPSGVSRNDLNKTINRTIQVVDPHTQKVTTTTQSVHLTRTANVDEVSGAVTYGNWTTGEWPVFNTPNVTGYTSSQTNVAKATVTDTTKDQTVKVTYNANPQATHVKYVDKDNPSNVIHTTNVSGKTDQTVSVSSEVPAGWQLVSGQSVPKNVTFTATGYPDTTVKIEHKHTTVSPDHPKTTNDKLPNNPTKNYPAGVAQNDLNKTITRTIQVVDPHTQKVTTTTQPVHLTRTANVDEVSGAVTYGKWTTGEWPTFNTPSVAGYTPTQGNVAKVTVTDITKDQTVKITYNANAQTTHVKYVDKDNSSNIIHTTNVSGKTDQTVSVPSEVPAGWQLVSGQSVPKNVTFTATGYPDTTVKVEHKHTMVTPDHPKTINDKLPDNPTKNYPAGVGQNDLNKMITRTIQVTDPHTQKVTTTNQSVHLTRTADVDEVSGAVTYGKWTTGEWPVFNTPSLAGYTPSQASVAKATVTDTTKDQTVKITYNANSQTTHVKYVDKDNPGNVIHTTNVSGKTDQTVSVPSEVPAGWQLVSGQSVPKNVTFTATGYPDTTIKIEHKHTTVTPDHPKTTNDKLPDNPTKNYPAGVSQNDLNKTITRTIQVTDPHTQQVTTTAQPVHLTRTANVDEVSGAVTYGNWATSEWPVFNTPNVSGYTPSQTIVAKTPVTDTTKDQTVKITYSANAQTTHIKYVDKDNSSNVIHTTNVSGKTDQTVNVPSEVPAGWQLVSGQSVPKNVTFTASGYPDTIVKIEHKHVTVAPDRPKTPADKLPDNSTKSYPVGVGQNDLNKTITRTIQVTDPHTQKVTTTTQSVHLTRTADVDEVSGAVTYGKWTTGEWPVFNTPNVPGYIPSQANVTKMTVTDTTKDQTVKITYTANPQSTTVNYVDQSGQTIHTTLVKGITDQTVKVPSEVPAGWKLVAGQTLPSQLIFGPAGYPAVTVKIAHGQVTINPDQPKTPSDKLPDNPTKSYPAGVAKDDLNKTITRTIQVVDPHTQKVATTSQSVHLTRTAKVDEVDGTVTYGNWTTGTWNVFTAPAVPGYTATQASVNQTTVTVTTKDQTVKITYAANPQSTTINYVDQSGKIIHTTPVKGVTDQTVAVSNEVLAGWQLVAGQTVPNNLTFGPAGHPTVTVQIEHRQVTVTPDHPKTPADTLPDNPAEHYPSGVAKDDLNKTITRTIQVVDPHTQKVTTTTQSVHLTRTADVDEVSGAVTYGKWTTGEWPVFNVPNVPGYTPSQANVAKMTVTDTTKDQTVKITYAANSQSTTVNYVDKDGKVVHSTLIKGVTDQTVKVPNEVPANWQLISGQTVPSEITLGANGHEPVTVKIEHRTTTTQAQKTITRTINYLDANGKHLKPSTVQRLTFMRTGVQDLVTNAIAWQATPAQRFAAVNNLYILGYKADMTTVPAVTVNWDDSDLIVDVHYQVANSTVTINFVDALGQVVKATPVTGQVGSTVDLAAQVPDGWVTYSPSLPTRAVIGASPAAINYLIGHRLALVKSTAGVKAGDLIPDTLTKTFNDNVNVDHLVTQASYTINIWADAAHTRKLATKTYHTDFIRNAVVDAVTGDVYYFNWSEGGQHVFAGFTRPAGNGYQAVVVPAWTATQADPTKTVDVVAQPQQASGTIQYQTMDGKVISRQAFAGNQAVTLTAPQGYTLLTNVAAITPALGRDQIYTVYVRPAQTLYTATDQLPAGVESLRKTVTRTIHITEANGHVRTITQRVHFTRTATVKADGSIEYSDWQATGRAVWNKVFLPKRHGYHVVIDNNLAKMNVTGDMRDALVNVWYVKD